MFRLIQTVAIGILALAFIILGEMSFQQPFFMEQLRPFFTTSRTGKRARAGAISLIIPLAFVYFNHPSRTEIVCLSIVSVLCLVYGFSGFVVRDGISPVGRIGRTIILFVICCGLVVSYDWHFWPIPPDTATSANSITPAGITAQQTITSKPSVANGLQSPLSVTSAKLIFKDQRVGTTSDPQSVTVVNRETSPQLIAPLIITGDFSQTNDCGSELMVGDSCNIAMTFSPIKPGLVEGDPSVVAG